MRETIDAIYENGVLKPLRELEIVEGQRIRLTFEIDDEAGTSEPAVTQPFERVRRALRGCDGELSEDLAKERGDRV